LVRSGPGRNNRIPFILLSCQKRALTLITFSLSIPSGFRLRDVIYSHGWSTLPPFGLDEEGPRLGRLFRLAPGRLVGARVNQADARLRLAVVAGGPLAPAERTALRVQAARCLRLDEDLTEFHALAAAHPRFRWVARRGAGRLLRSPTVFEDVVKMICTTNCAWAQTRAMTARLCATFGEPDGNGGHAFPEPAAVAEAAPRLLRERIRAGYRAPFILDLARRIARGRLDLEGFRSASVPSEELYRELRALRGLGEYAAGAVLKLLGRYDYLALDVLCRKRFARIRNGGRPASDQAIARAYERFGRWRGLFCWMDLTRDWYRLSRPFARLAASKPG